MAVDIAKLGLEIDSSGAVRATKNLDSMTGASERATKSTDKLADRSAATGRMLGRMIGASTALLGAMTANSLRLGVAAEETANQFQVLFRGSVVESNARLVELTKTIPLTVSQMRSLASGIQGMLVPMGMARDKAADMSVEMIKVAGDIGALKNVNPDKVLQDFQSALAGSTETVRKYGIVLNQSRLESIAYREGIAETGAELTAAQKAQASFIAITEDSTDALAAAGGASKSTADQLKFMRRDLVQAQEDLGQALIPAFAELLSVLNEVDEDGLTPLQSGLIAVSNLILGTAKTVLLAVAGWKMLGNAIGDTFRIISTMQGSDIMTLLASAAGGPVAVGQAAADMIHRKATDTSDAISKIRQEALEADKELAASLDNIFKVVAGLDAAIEKNGSGIDRSLADARAGMAETGNAADDMAMAVVTAVRRMDEALRQERDAGLNFIDFEGVRLGMQQEIDALNGGAEAWRDYQRAMFEAQQVAMLGPDATEEQIALIQQLAGELFDARDAFGQVADSASALGEAMMQSADIAAEAFRDLQKGVGREDDLYDKLTVAIEAANVVKAIGAILTQGEGDPYTAFARMAAMAAAVASLGISVGNLSGGFSDTAANRQESQGTGSVLGDVTAKSESISKAIQITANATSELVGINRGMLHALQSLSAGISGGANVLARTSGDGQFSGLPSVFSFEELLSKLPLGGIFGDLLGGILDSILGGSAKVTDEGIAILGGTIGDLINGTLIAAFQEVQYKKWAFGSKKTREELIALGGEAAAQFGLIFEALADTVREGAMALGLSQELIEERLAAFEVAEQRISLMDLTAEEQAAEIEAVISTIFDDMVAAVIPFVRQFQQVGEGLGETLVRVATSVQVFQEAVKQLGFAAQASDPELLAQMAVGLVDLAGGVENFIAQFTTFMDKFASDEQKLEFATDQLTRAFTEAGLVLPDTRDGMWALMQSMDATTEAGREQIATILQLAGVADQYYTLTEQAERDRLAAAQAAADLARQQFDTVQAFLGMGPPQALVNLRNAFVESMKAAKSLGASQAEYAMQLRKFDRDLQRMAAEMTVSVIRMSQDLFSTSSDGFVGAVTDGIEEVRMVANSLFGEWQRALTNLKGFADGLLLDESLTTLTPQQQLSEAQRQFERTLSAARGGDVEAAGNLPDAARAFLEEARFMFASGAQYDAIFKQVQQQLRGVEMPKGIEEFTAEIATNTAATVDAVRTAQDETVARLDRLIKAMDLANALRDLSFVLERGTVGLAQELGVPLDQLAEALGIDLSDMSMDTLMGILNMAELLGSDIHDLGTALGLDLQMLADSLGVDLLAFDFDTQFAREIDYLDSIWHELLQANIWLERLVDPFLDNKSKEGITTAPTTPITSPQSATTTQSTGITSEQADQMIVLWTDVRDSLEDANKQTKDGQQAITRALTDTADAIRRTA